MATLQANGGAVYQVQRFETSSIGTRRSEVLALCANGRILRKSGFWETPSYSGVKPHWYWWAWNRYAKLKEGFTPEQWKEKKLASGWTIY